MARILDDHILLWARFISDIILYHVFSSLEIYRAEISLTRIIEENQGSNVSQLDAFL